MATIELFANKMTQMPMLIDDLINSISDYSSQLSYLNQKMLSVDSQVCNLEYVMNSLQSSTQTQEQIMDDLEVLQQNNEEFIADVFRIDEDVADMIEENKEDFYEQYTYLKPECEKSDKEKINDAFDAAGEWCCDVLTAAGDWCSDVLSSVGEWCGELWENIVSVAVAIVETVETIINVINLIAEDLKNLDFFNDDPEKLFEANFLSFYKGVPYIWVSSNDAFAFSYGAVFMGDEYKDMYADARSGTQEKYDVFMKNFTDTVNHEWGHRQHMDEIGIINYTIYVAIPSVTFCHLGDKLKEWGLNPFPTYYDAPWEHIADHYGGVDRDSQYPIAAAITDRNTAYYFDFWDGTLLPKLLINAFDNMKSGGGGSHF